MPTIELENVSKFYKPNRRRRNAVHQDKGVENVELTIRQGEFVFVVGGSGAGKSTLLRLITGQTKPSRGKVYVDNKDLNGVMRLSRNRASILFGKIWQDPTLIRKTPGWWRYALKRCWAWWGCGAQRKSTPWSCLSASAAGWNWPGP